MRALPFRTPLLRSAVPSRVNFYKNQYPVNSLKYDHIHIDTELIRLRESYLSKLERAQGEVAAFAGAPDSTGA